ncbi:MAG: Asp23/Gls24 family envelope stress response protein [Lactobacillus sp.]|uniref:Asp23/Gls24 family envelope stress response protein n=1 Tax=Bombilactobacillus bombi TaxID=1303590 RepID=A0A347SQN9_9LACO|nr:Asp23/Gls24 family envelope stress response protein [Bombilactobacillus bombi]MCO6541643.1 Asp23/Gls24 family envelope stress response protein [Lactobacillus sp.]AXX64348.1 Asp23/Gls24 family envelope stress response protein [Bombilactobacillus bombi]MCO6543025.1 Asp23/Gls24 family envelope stress response protein [Lactobacillus sp.]RHW48426.1 Asp23/Gls24 family envelope stress response protein [Bombilactobacillus bombi]RHW49646.1 Asp23/Gls24 family envelope stress response protein [Bombila
MAVSIQTKYGNVDISNEVIATIVGCAATDIYGIVGMASKNQLRDGFNTILKRENFAKGVVVRQTESGTIVDVYIIVGYGVKISEVCRNVQSKVKYNLETLLGAPTAHVNVYVQGVKILEED